MVKLELKRNGFPSRIAHALFRRFSSNALNKNHTTANNSKEKDEPVNIWLSIPYIGEKTSQLLGSFKRKLRRHKIVLLHQQQRQSTTFKQITSRLQIQLSWMPFIIHWQN